MKSRRHTHTHTRGETPQIFFSLCSYCLRWIKSKRKGQGGPRTTRLTVKQTSLAFSAIFFSGSCPFLCRKLWCSSVQISFCWVSVTGLFLCWALLVLHLAAVCRRRSLTQSCWPSTWPALTPNLSCWCKHKDALIFPDPVEYSVHYVVLHRCKHKALKWADYCTGLLHYITLKHTTCTTYLECIPQIPDRLSIWVLNHKTHFCASCSGVMWCVCEGLCHGPAAVKESCSHSSSRVCDLSVFVPHSGPWRFAGRSSSIMDEKTVFFSPPLFLPGSWPFTDFFSRIPSYCDTLIKDKAIFLVPRKKYPPEGPRIIHIYTNSSVPGARRHSQGCLHESPRRIRWQLSAAPPCVFSSHRHQHAPRNSSDSHRRTLRYRSASLWKFSSLNTCCLLQNMCRY